MSKPRPKEALDPTTAYAVAVVEGAVVTGMPVLWACQRHLEDLEHGEKRAGLWFDHEAAGHFFRFCPLMRHVKDSESVGAGEPWKPEPWQLFVLGSVFGWKRDDGRRRFRQAWIEVARKAGKSFMSSGVGMYMLTCDGASGSEVYTAATKRQQARIIFETAMAVRDKSPHLRRIVRKLRDRLVVPETHSFFAPIGRDSKTEDGLNPHCVLIDEIHAHRDGSLWDVLSSAMTSRPQPLLFATTTAGHGVDTFGRNEHEYHLSVVDPKSGTENDAVFAYIASLDLPVAEGDEGDDPYDELVWEKVQPNLGVTVGLDKMREKATMAEQNPRSEAEFFTKTLNIWIQTEKRWISSERWDACGGKVDRKKLRTRPCFGGLDLSSNKDLTAYALYFPATQKERRAVGLVEFWCPEENVAERARLDRIDYSSWIRDGHMRATPGGWIDQDAIKVRMKELRQEFPRLQQVAGDPKYMEKLFVELMQDGFDVLRFHQGWSTFCAPTLEFERLVLSRGILHDRNPVLRWCVGNIVLKVGEQDDVMPSKKRSPERIDGGVALIMAIGVAGKNQVAPAVPPQHRSLSGQKRDIGKRKIYNVFR